MLRLNCLFASSHASEIRIRKYFGSNGFLASRIYPAVEVSSTKAHIESGRKADNYYGSYKNTRAPT